MKWRVLSPAASFADVGPYRFHVRQQGFAWVAEYVHFVTDDLHDFGHPIGEYRTEKAAKTYAYRRAKALVERMVREVRDA